MSWDPFSTGTEAAAAPAERPRPAQLSPVTASGGFTASATLTPRGNTLRKLKDLQRRRILDKRDVAILKDAVVDGNNITSTLALLQECSAGDRFKVDSIIATVPRPRRLVAKNSFRAIKTGSPSPSARGMKAAPSFGDLFSTPRAANRVAQLRGDAKLARPLSFSQLGAGADDDDDPFASPARSTPGKGGAEEDVEVVSVTDEGDEWWNNFATKGSKPAEPPAAPAAGAGTGAGAGGVQPPAPPADSDDTRKPTIVASAVPDLAAEADMMDSPVLTGSKAGKAVGSIYIRETHFLRRVWKLRHVMLSRSRFRIFESEAAMASGSRPMHNLKLSSSMELMPMKTGSVEGTRLHYREIAVTEPKHKRVVKFGVRTTEEVGMWAEAVRVALRQAAEREEQDAADQETIAHVLHPDTTDFKESDSRKGITNIFRPRRRSIDDGGKDISVTVWLLDGRKMEIPAPRGTILEGVCLAVKAELGLINDADFSVFLREKDEFACLPESMEAVNAMAAALSDSRKLVYRRRINMGSETALDEEAKKAESPEHAAHYLLYIENVYHVVKDHYVIPQAQAHRLAALHFHSDAGAFNEADPATSIVALRRSLPLYVSALTCYKRSLDDVASDVHDIYRSLKGVSKLAAQREYIEYCQGLPSYGSRCFRGKMFREVAGESGAGSPSRVPPLWMKQSLRSAGLEVLVAINATGIFVRPAPPVHDVSYNPERGIEPGVDWYLHPTNHIEVWGVKKMRPELTYRVRENRVMEVQVRSVSFKEMASVINMYVYQLLADREGKKAATMRLAHDAAINAVDDDAPLPEEWVEIKDPLTGQVCWWNQLTKETVFSKPTMPDARAQQFGTF